MEMLNSAKKFTVIALFFLLSISPAMAQTPDDLFTNRPEWVNPSQHGFSAHAAPVDTGLISRGVNNIRILLPDGTEAELERDGFEKRGPGDIAWRGRVAGDKDSSATLTLKKGWLFGLIYTDGRVYEIKPQHGRKVIVEELDTASFPDCGNDVSTLVDTAGEVSGGGAAATGDPVPAGDASIVIDLLSVYTPQARAAAGGTTQMEAQIQAAVDAANTAFIDSNMNVRFRLVHTAEAAHNDAGDMGTDLDWVRADTAVASLRDQYGADMVSLITEDGAGYCGLGYVQRSPGPGFEDWAFQVTDRGCLSNQTLSHEHGHNMGMEHNWENSSATSSTASYLHSFAHYINGSYRTVMSYSNPCPNGCTRVGHFSNPDVIHNGYATGITGERDNALTGDLTGPIVADFRAAVEPPADSTRFAVIGDYGSDDSDFDERDVADLVASWSPDFVITAGDNRYGSISMDSAVGKYYCDFLTDAGSGSFCSGGNAATNAFFPSLGNHDYTDGGNINEYLGYFTLPGAGISTTGTSSSEKYYDFVQGPVHFFVVDSYLTSGFSEQQIWLQQQLAASTTPWQVVYFHHAPYSSSSSHGSVISMQWDFASWGADAVISGHDHTYERLEIDGIPYFVNGLGGMSRYSFATTPVAGSIVRYRDNYGAMLVDASETAMTFQFINVAGTVIDAYTTEPSSDGVLNIRVTQSSDDGEELVDPSPELSYSTGHMVLTSTDLEMADDSGWHGGEQAVGIRFQNVNIPQGAAILAAYLEFATDEVGSELTTIYVHAQDSDDAATFTTTAFNISSRPSTSATVTWTIPAWNSIGEHHVTPDLTAVVQEVVDRDGWAANNSMAFLITGSGVRTAAAYDGVAGLAPLLHVEYDTQPTTNVSPTADFSSTTTDLTANFTDASLDSDGTIVSWSWNFGDSNTSSAQNPSNTYAAAGTYPVSLTVTDNDGATDTTNQSVTVTAPDTTPPSITAPADVTVEATGPNSPVSLGTPTVSDDTDPTPTVINNAPAAFPLGVSIVTWTATDVSGNSATAFQTVTVIDTTAPSITAPDDISVESSVPLAVDLGTPTVLDVADPAPVVNHNSPTQFPLGTTTVTWTAIDASGNSATATQTVTVSVPNTPPTAGFIFITTDLTANFTDASLDSDGTIVSWSWNFGDGNASSAQNPPSHTYAGAGTYTVSLTVTDNGGASDTASQSVTVTAPLPVVVHVGDLDVTKSGNKRWTAYVNITVHEDSHNGISGVTVSGTWSGGFSGIGSCVTDNSGQCALLKVTKGDSLTFTVDSLTGENVEYDIDANHDSDGNSNGTSITINKDGTIPGPNQPPEFKVDPISGDNAQAGQSYSGSLAGSATDPNGDSLSFSKIGGPDWLDVAADGTLSGTPQVLRLDTFTVAVSDGKGGSAEAILNIWVIEELPVMNIHVGDLDGSATTAPKNRWNASVTVTVEDDVDGSPVQAVTVSGSWSTGAGGTCTTDILGTCTIEKRNFKSNVASTDFTVTNLTGTNMNYVYDDNHDPDGDSNGTSIIINKP